MPPPDDRRRTRRYGLLLAASLIPTAVVIALVGLVARQEHELAERRAAEAQREALEQLRRELTARLQALRLEEVNRLIGESGTQLPPDSPIVFVAPIVQDEMMLPWVDRRPVAPPSRAFLRAQQEGESFEFQQADPGRAVASYEGAMRAARTPSERCAGRLSLGRTYLKAGRLAASEQIDRHTVTECADVVDADGVPFATYAAERLLQHGRQVEAVTAYAMHAIDARRWPSPSAASALRSLLQRLPDIAAERLAHLTRVIHDLEQAAALARDIRSHPHKLRQASPTSRGDLPWMGYGDDPWLVTLVSPTSFAVPVVIAVAPRRLVPAGVTLHSAAAPEAVALGDGFVDLHVRWPAGRFGKPGTTPRLVYGTVLAVVLGAGVLAAFLLLRDVHRESDTALMRSNFVASVTHELKTPLTSIRAHAETLLMGRAGAAATDDYLKTIVSESERLGRLVDSVLEFSRIEQGRKTYHMQPTRLGDVVDAAARMLEYPLAQLGVTLTVASDGTNPTLNGDRAALIQAVLNVLGNAMKYSGGAKRIDVRMGTRSREAFVDVVDHGIGIPRSEQSRIFERFHRVQSVETAGIAGAGLGLALALHVVKAHHGRIDVVSDVGRGSTFSIHLPVEAEA